MAYNQIFVNGHSPAESLQRFIEMEDLSLLDKPLLFPKNDSFKSLQCCLGACMGLFSFGISALFCPIGTFCQPRTFDKFQLRLDSDAVQLSSAMNDFCCHIAESRKTVPLEKIQDVELVENCVLTCFGGLKQVNVQTAGSTAPGAEISAAFLASPEQARQAIQLAAKLRRQRDTGMAPPMQQSGMQRTAATAGPGQLGQRLCALEQLVMRGVLSRTEADSLKLAVLIAPQDPTQHLVEAKELHDRGMLTADEFASLKASLVQQIVRAT